MDYLTTRGLVLRTTEYKETDRILTVLSADRGLLTMKARGVRSNRSKLKGACQLLTYAEFTVGEAHGFSSITEATVLEMFPELRTDIELLALASYFAQLAEVLSQEDAASPALLPLILPCRFCGRLENTMQEMNPDTVLEQAAPAADPEPQAGRPAEDTSIPSAPEVPAAEAAAPQPEAPAEPAPVTVVDIRFRNNAKSYFFDPNGLTLAVGDHVIIDTARGDEFGICAAGNHAVRPRELVLPLRKVLRAATEHDERINAENQEKEKKAFDVCQQKILSHKLDMQLVSAECAFDGSKILFFFTAEGRVDFRELVKDLASQFHTRIELRQIGVRDESKMLGGLGLCGQPFCCSRFLKNFQPVSIKMAKEQGLSLNPAKISGSCGRLMCCLAYEQKSYEYLNSITPQVGSIVRTPDGEGTVIEVNVVAGTLKVRSNVEILAPRIYKRDECVYVRGGKRTPLPADKEDK